MAPTQVITSFQSSGGIGLKSNTFSKTSVTPLLGKIFPFSFLICFTTTQGFQKRYITLFYLNWLRKCGLSKLEVYEKRPFYYINRKKN